MIHQVVAVILAIQTLILVWNHYPAHRLYLVKHQLNLIECPLLVAMTRRNRTNLTTNNSTTTPLLVFMCHQQVCNRSVISWRSARTYHHRAKRISTSLQYVFLYSLAPPSDVPWLTHAQNGRIDDHIPMIYVGILEVRDMLTNANTQAAWTVPEVLNVCILV